MSQYSLCLLGSGEATRERVSAYLSGFLSVRYARGILTTEHKKLKRHIASKYLRRVNLPEAYENFANLLQQWDRIVDDISLLKESAISLLIDIGHAVDCLARFSPEVTYDVESLESWAKNIKTHSYFKHIDAINWLDTLNGTGGNVGIGYIDLQIIPTTLAEIFGWIAQDVGDWNSSFDTIRFGGGRRFYQFMIELSTETGKCLNNQKIIQNLERCINLVLLLSNYGVWSKYAFAADQIRVASIGSENADDQMVHCDINEIFPAQYSSDCSCECYPLACILSLQGETCLTIEPFSWGCMNRGESTEFNLAPGHILVFRGNFIHGGRKHNHVSWRVHWYRPLACQMFDGKKLEFC